jgi:hypothetical protein
MQREQEKNEREGKNVALTCFSVVGGGLLASEEGQGRGSKE